LGSSQLIEKIAGASKRSGLVQVGNWQAPFIVAAALLVVGSAVWAFWLDPDKHILTS
jgi:hypothetical protein